MTQQPDSTTTAQQQQPPLHHLLQSCLLNNTKNEVSQCLNDESPIHCFWDILHSRIITRSSGNTTTAAVTATTSTSTSIASLLMMSSSSAATEAVYTPTKAELRNAHGNLRQDWNLSSLIWN